MPGLRDRRLDLRIGQRIRDLRLAAGLTQAQLAEPEFSKGLVSLVETGRSGVSMRSATIFAARLRVPVESLYPEAVLSNAERERALKIARANADFWFNRTRVLAKR